MQHNFQKHTTEQIDILAWEAICSCTSNIINNILCDDASIYAESISLLLWDKVGRSIRFSIDPSSSLFENKLVAQSSCFAEPAISEFQIYKKYLTQRIQAPYNYVRKILSGSSQQYCCNRQTKPLIYAPIVSDRLYSIVSSLALGNAYQMVVSYSLQPISGADSFCPVADPPPDYSVSLYCYKSIIRTLSRYGIVLLDFDASKLRAQLINLSVQVARAQMELAVVQPDALLVHSDNHPPFQPYVLAARRRGIPVVMLQHGLDCERFYLEEAYATHIAVWGNVRERRYREHSRFKPQMSVTGNPAYDHLSLPEEMHVKGHYWLWVTRPHTPGKCFSPSRFPVEGLNIARALTKALVYHPKARLVIAPHPDDYRNIYESLLSESAVGNRILLSNNPLCDLLPDASLVITEDTTAGLDAMLLGKLLLHAHFAESAPVMPFVDYGAAIPGFSEEQLLEAISTAALLSNSAMQDVYKGQISFINDYAGPCDGMASKRFTDYIGSILLA